jgi:hypothetical protein
LFTETSHGEAYDFAAGDLQSDRTATMQARATCRGARLQPSSVSKALRRSRARISRVEIVPIGTFSLAAASL